ncbi:hypothetical protein EQV77_05835 [Halobacillus fulvus]|nr:hypothetical protein EQV77_05835 [Halobacillus fulvus]
MKMRSIIQVLVFFFYFYFASTMESLLMDVGQRSGTFTFYIWTSQVLYIPLGFLIAFPHWLKEKRKPGSWYWQKKKVLQSIAFLYLLCFPILIPVPSYLPASIVTNPSVSVASQIIVGYLLSISLKKQLYPSENGRIRSNRL